jgi:hypothetical protein
VFVILKRVVGVSEELEAREEAREGDNHKLVMYTAQ